jgi:hypothetical protein
MEAISAKDERKFTRKEYPGTGREDAGLGLGHLGRINIKEAWQQSDQ